MLSNVCLQLLNNFLVDLRACWTIICLWRDGWAPGSISIWHIIFVKLVWHRMLSTFLLDHLLTNLLRSFLHWTKLIIIFEGLKSRLIKPLWLGFKRSHLNIIQDWSSDIFFHHFLPRFTVVFQWRNHMMLTFALVFFSFIGSLNHFGFNVFKFEIDYHVNRNINIL